jgi:hypothetical protein
LGDAEELLAFAVFPVFGIEDNAAVFLADAKAEEHEPGAALYGIGADDGLGVEGSCVYVEPFHIFSV